MPEVGKDEAVSFLGVSVGSRARSSCCLPCLPGRSACTPGLWCLGRPERAIAEAKESGCRGSEQECSDRGWHQAVSTDRRQEPEAKNA